MLSFDLLPPKLEQKDDTMKECNVVFAYFGTDSADEGLVCECVYVCVSWGGGGCCTPNPSPTLFPIFGKLSSKDDVSLVS
jgi:hypothetical protein